MEEGRLAPAPVWTDLRSFDGAAWSGCVDIVSAGYPCQPFSCAGARKGVEDPRHLWPEVKRIIRECGPALVVLENVQGHISKGLRQVLEDLMELGFDAEWGVYSAAQAGSTQRRNRVFVLAYRCGRGFPFERQALDQDGGDASRDNIDRLDEAVAHSRRERPQGCNSGQGGKGLADTRSKRPQGIVSTRPTPRAARRGSRAEVSDATFPPGPEGDWSNVPEDLWPATESSIRGVVDGVPVRVDQLRALGNAVVPQQAALALRDLWARIR